MAKALRNRNESGVIDFEALESGLREMLFHCGTKLLENVLTANAGEYLSRDCQCGGTFVNRKWRSKEVLTVLGPINLNRIVQACNHCGKHRVADDIVLDVVKTGFSPGVRRILAKCGALLSFDRARDLIFELAGIRVTDKDVERISEAIGADIANQEEAVIEGVFSGNMTTTSQEQPNILYIAIDGTGIPVLKKETIGRKGKSADGVAKTREVKLGAIFTQTTQDEKGNPIRDVHSTTYVGKIETSEQFGARIYAASLNRGLNTADQIIVLGDGAPWIWKMAEEHFYDATQIVDYYHACEHLISVGKTLFSDMDEQLRNKWLDEVIPLLKEGTIEQMLTAIRTQHQARVYKQTVAKKVEQEIAFFEKNTHRMRYGQFKKSGYFIGSGVVEAGCRSVIGQRLKQSGMHWSIRGANSIIALRCCLESNQFEDYWESRIFA